MMPELAAVPSMLRVHGSVLGRASRAGDSLLLATDRITEARHYFPGNLPDSRGSSFLELEGLTRRVGQQGSLWQTKEVQR
jgi:hypothetical protein